MPAAGAQHDQAHARVLVQGLEHETQLVALGHLDDIERRPVEDDVSPFERAVDLDAEAIERGQARVGEWQRCTHAGVPFSTLCGGLCSGSHSPATSRRRMSLPTGDFGKLATNAYRRGRLKLASPDARQKASSSSGSTGARRLMKAATTLPQRASGRPTTATSDTAGCRERRLSISTGDTFSPPVMIKSSVRP